MLDPRLYRAALLPGLATLVVVMFSVVSRPEPIRTDIAPDGFDGGRATELARQIIELAPERQPGSDGDLAVSDLVASHFAAVEGGDVTEQDFEGRFDGDDVDLRNVILRVPGETDERILIAAPRDCAEGPCAASSAAATAALLELAANFNGVQHARTLVFVSLDGSAAGAAGAKRLAETLAEEPAEAVIVLTAVGSKDRAQPFVVPWSAGPQSSSNQLVRSAEKAVTSEVGSVPEEVGFFSTLARLSIPAGLGDQAPLVEAGVDAVALSSAGEAPLPPTRDGPDSLSEETLGDFGRATLALTLGLDQHAQPPEHGPDAYVPLAGKLIPGWALALLAITLLLPVGVVSIDGLVRSARRGEPALLAVGWVLSRAIPFAGTLLLAYLLGLLGLIATPEFPYDPARLEPGVGGSLGAAVLLVAFAALLVLARPIERPAGSEGVLAPAVGVAVFVACLALWLANPYFALLLVPAANLWLLASTPGLRGRLPTATALVLGGAVLPALAVSDLASRLDLGTEVPWHLLVMVTGGHFGPLAAIPLAVLGGSALAALSVARRP